MAAYGSWIQSAWRAGLEFTSTKETNTQFKFTALAFIENGGTGSTAYYIRDISSKGTSTVKMNGTTFLTDTIPAKSHIDSDPMPYSCEIWGDEEEGYYTINKTDTAQTLTITATISLPKWVRTTEAGTTKTFTNTTTTVTLTKTIPAASNRTITYDANGGVNAPLPQTAIATSPITITSDIPTREGYTFLGWAVYKPNDVMRPPYSTSGYKQPGDSWTGTNNATLYALWGYGYGISLDSITAKRVDANGDESDEGEFGLITGTFKIWGALTNTATLSAKYKISDANTWNDISTSLINPATYTKAESVRTITTVEFNIGPFSRLDTDTTYSVMVQIVDSGNNTKSLEDYISTAFFTIDIKNGGKEIAFGTPANDENIPNNGLFKCGMDARFEADTKVIGQLTTEGNITSQSNITAEGNIEATGNMTSTEHYTNPRTLNLGVCACGAVLTTDASALYFTIPTGRVFPSGTEITRITGTMSVRASNRNGTGMYIMKSSSGGSSGATFDTARSIVSTFYDGANNKRTPSAKPSLNLYGGTNIYFAWATGTNNYFSGNATNTSYINNQACMVMLTNLVIYLE